MTIFLSKHYAGLQHLAKKDGQNALLYNIMSVDKQKWLDQEDAVRLNVLNCLRLVYIYSFVGVHSPFPFLGSLEIAFLS